MVRARHRSASSHPDISVIIPFRDVRRYLPAALRSVQRQEQTGCEVILVDDASRDGSSVYARRQARALGWKYIRLARPSGPAAARAEGVRRSRGVWIAFLDGDDLWEPDKLKIQSQWMRKPGVVMTFTDFRLIDARGRACPRRIRVPVGGDYWFYPHVCATSMVMLQRKALEKVGGIAADYRYLFDDMDLWGRLYARFGRNGCRFVPARLGAYRVHRGMVSRIPKDARAGAAAEQKHLDYALFLIRMRRLAAA